MGEDADELAGLFISEIRDGMFAYDPDEPLARRTDVRAGVIKIATGPEGVSGAYTAVFEAAVRAHLETGAPIVTHTELGAYGPDQATFLISRGVAPESIVIGHMDRRADLHESVRAAEQGVFLAYDTVARYKYHSDEEELNLIDGLVEGGFGDRLLMGMDVTRDRLCAYGGKFGLVHLALRFADLLRERIGGENTAAIFRDNPRRALSFRNS
jgi:phosphotriesterase-related protein